VLEDWGVLPVLKVSHFSCPVARLRGSQRPCVPPSRQGSILLATLGHSPGIIVAIGQIRRRVTPKSTPRRLILRRFEDSDLTPFVAYRNDPEVARYQGWDSCDEQEAKALIREMGAARVGVPGEWFGFAIDSKATGVLIGS
jgi:hypothetical protein